MSKPADLPSEKSSASFWLSEPSAKLIGHRSTADLPREVDVAIVGSGISGASVAYHLLNGEKPEAEKQNVLVLEAREVCWGATGRNGGHCLPMFYEHPHDPSISNFEYANFLALSNLVAAQNISCEWNTQPGIRGLYSTEEVELARIAVTTLQQNNPSLGAMVRVADKTEDLLKLSLRVPEAKVTSLSPTDSGTWNLHTGRGNIVAKKVVLATNAYTSHLIPQMADLIVPCRGQMSALIPGSSFSGPSRTTTSFAFIGPEMDDYLVQRPEDKGAHLMFGGGRSFGPSLGTCDDEEVDANVARYLRTSLPRLLVSGDGQGERELKAEYEWTGIMGFSRDGLPWVGAVPEHKGVFVVAGYTGHGMPNAWLCGKSVATMVIGDDMDAAMEKATDEGLPRAYLLNEERIARARKLETVEVQDEDHMFKAEVVAQG
ncbi:FAD dependent oxidoreductase [Aureobasidium subglaciale]|nr:FAD dependent oxidoreductase [Aureobasidium subglaciale]